jgi:hypothetical protein
MLQRALSQVIKPTCRDIFFKLLIPSFRIKFSQLSAEIGKLFR